MNKDISKNKGVIKMVLEKCDCVGSIDGFYIFEHRVSDEFFTRYYISNKLYEELK